MALYHPSPVITKAPQNQAGIDGSVATFTCEATGKSPVSIQWFRNGVQLCTGLRFVITRLRSGGSMLRMSPIRRLRDDGKVIRCQATDLEGNAATSNATLTVYGADTLPVGYPVVSTYVPHIVATKNFPSKIYCAANGDPQPEIVWFKDYDPVESDTRISITDSHLHILRTQRSDQGLYQCAARNAFGTRYSVGTLLYVTESSQRDSPSVKVTATSKEVTPGEEANLTCTAEGDPTPIVRWILEDPTESGGSVSDILGMGRSEIILTNITVSATYTCEAASILGTEQASMRITVL
ncbi:receptor-type tyrosine-protein phosphatase F-like, partial [Diadema antillarum]|uniref:receptor-type tyrosine-protein phosphatase F-like n=1 Tax=Diadema antillarum TaxID=105358 RepID=UPI003A83A993